MADNSGLVVILPSVLTTISGAAYFWFQRRDKATDRQIGEVNRRRRADFNCSKLFEALMSARQCVRVAKDLLPDDPVTAKALLLQIDAQPMPSDPMAEYYGNGGTEEPDEK